MEATCISETLAKLHTIMQYNNPRTQLTSIISYVLQYLQMWCYNFVYVKFCDINHFGMGMKISLHGLSHKNSVLEIVEMAYIWLIESCYCDHTAHQFQDLYVNLLLTFNFGCWSKMGYVWRHNWIYPTSILLIHMWNNEFLCLDDWLIRL
jgi:hypothetical protein